MLFGVCCLWPCACVACFLLFAMRCVLFVVCCFCLLFDVCCLLLVLCFCCRLLVACDLFVVVRVVCVLLACYVCFVCLCVTIDCSVWSMCV